MNKSILNLVFELGAYYNELMSINHSIRLKKDGSPNDKIANAFLSEISERLTGLEQWTDKLLDCIEEISDVEGKYESKL